MEREEIAGETAGATAEGPVLDHGRAVDTMIAAHARSKGLAIITENLHEFSRVPHLHGETRLDRLIGGKTIMRTANAASSSRALGA